MNMVLDRKWYVVYCQAKSECLARDQLINQGFESYLPLYKKQIRHARQTRESLAPLFPRYLFVAFDVDQDQWRVINATRGIVGLVRFNTEQPISIASEVIVRLKATEDARGLVSLAGLDYFQPGQKVRILQGAFSGYTAIYQKMTDQERVEILIDFLNQPVPLQLPVCAVEKVISSESSFGE